jgi:hypothetical protein
MLSNLYCKCSSSECQHLISLVTMDIVPAGVSVNVRSIISYVSSSRDGTGGFKPLGNSVQRFIQRTLHWGQPSMLDRLCDNTSTMQIQGRDWHTTIPPCIQIDLPNRLDEEHRIILSLLHIKYDPGSTSHDDYVKVHRILLVYTVRCETRPENPVWFDDVHDTIKSRLGWKCNMDLDKVRICLQILTQVLI